MDIFRAALEGQARLVQAAIESDSSIVNARDGNSDNRGPLQHACSSGSLEIVQLLLSSGADVEAKGRSLSQT